MKGFPNQVADLHTLTRALQVIQQLAESGSNPKDNGVLGEALIRRGVLGTGHTPIPADVYLAQQEAIPRKSNRSHRTRARQLRQLFRVLNLIAENGTVRLTPTGRQIANLAGAPLTAEGFQLWRTVILNMTHDGGDGVSSHPYQVLLRLVVKRPGITRAKCALALEAKDDSEAELDRITELSGLNESVIIRRIGTKQSNWENAKKILPHFAEQLGDVRKVGQQFYLASSPGAMARSAAASGPAGKAPQARQTRTPSQVTADTIATTRTEEQWDETIDDPAGSSPDPEAIRARKRNLTDRFNRHQRIVKAAAAALAADGAKLFETPFDCLARFRREGLLVEVKSLDGTPKDEVDRVREALAQLLYYEAFAVGSLLEDRQVKKIACFERKVSDAHIAWLEASDIRVIWVDGDGFRTTPRARGDLSGHFGF